MAASIFYEKAVSPSDGMVETVLGDKKALWDKLEAHIFQNCMDAKKEWKFYSKKAGWSLVFKEKSRTLLYFAPFDGYFKVWFVFGDKAIATAKQSSLPEKVLEAISTASAYTEGTLFDVDVAAEHDLTTAMMLLEIKRGS